MDGLYVHGIDLDLGRERLGWVGVSMQTRRGRRLTVDRLACTDAPDADSESIGCVTPHPCVTALFLVEALLCERFCFGLEGLGVWKKVGEGAKTETLTAERQKEFHKK